MAISMDRVVDVAMVKFGNITWNFNLMAGLVGVGFLLILLGLKIKGFHYCCIARPREQRLDEHRSRELGRVDNLVQDVRKTMERLDMLVVRLKARDYLSKEDVRGIFQTNKTAEIMSECENDSDDERLDEEV